MLTFELTNGTKTPMKNPGKSQLLTQVALLTLPGILDTKFLRTYIVSGMPNR